MKKLKKIAAALVCGCMVLGTQGAIPANAEEMNAGKQNNAETWLMSEDYASEQGMGNWYYLERTGGANSSSLSDMKWDEADKVWKGENGSKISKGKMYPSDNGDAALAWECPQEGYYKISGWGICENSTGDGVLVKVVKGNESGISDWAAGQVWPELEQGSSSWYNDTGYTILRSDTDRDNIPGLYQNTVMWLEKGERLFFLVNANENSDDDEVIWNPSVEMLKELPFSFDNRGVVVRQGYVDGSLALVKRADGTYDAYNSVGYAFSGNTHHRWHVKSLDPLTYEPLDNLPAIGNCEGYPSPWLNYIENMHKISDNGTPDDSSDDIIMAFMHLENYTDVNAATTNVTYKLGLAVSRDGGETFTQAGDVLGNALDQSVIKANAIPGGFNIQGIPFIVAPDGYLYIYYSESMPIDTDVRKYGRMTLSVARARYDDVVRAVLYGDEEQLAGLFHKYYNGVWSEPGIDNEYDEYMKSGGYGASVEDNDRGAHTMICYNEFADKNVMVNCSNRGYSIKFSSDPNSWFVPSYIFDKGDFYFYGTLADEDSEDPYLLGQDFHAFYGDLNDGYRQTTFTLTDQIKSEDTDALRDYIRAVSLDSVKSAEDVYDALAEKLENARNVLENNSADQAEINEALYELGYAYKNANIKEGTVYTEITNPGTLYVNLGTSAEKLELPDEIGVVNYEEGNREGQEFGTLRSTMVDVEWDLSQYDSENAGTYIITGRLNPLSNIEISNLKAEATVIVGQEKWSDNGPAEEKPEIPDPYQDDFSDGSTGGWKLLSGDPEKVIFGIEDESLRVAANGSETQPLAVDDTCPDYEDAVLQMTVIPEITAQSGWGTSNLGNFGIVFRCSSEDEYISIDYDYETNWYIKNGNKGNAAEFSGPRLEDGKQYNFKIEFSGNRISVFINDEKCYEGSLPGIKETSGKIGLREWGLGDVKVISTSVEPAIPQDAEYPGMKHSAVIPVEINRNEEQTGEISAKDFGIDTGLRGLEIVSIEPVGNGENILQAVPEPTGMSAVYKTNKSLDQSGISEDYLVTFSCEKYADFSVTVRFTTVARSYKTDLEEILQEAKNMNLDKYIETGKEAFLSAIKYAENILSNGDASPEIIENAYKQLKAAIESLKLKADKSELKELLESVAEIDLGGYTSESVQNYKEALSVAEMILKNDNLSTEDQSIIDNAVTALKAAKESLQPEQKPDTEPEKDPEQKPETTPGQDSEDKPAINDKIEAENKTESAQAVRTGDDKEMDVYLYIIGVCIVCMGGVLIRRKLVK